MALRRLFGVATLLWALSVAAPAGAHCDGVDGPVAAAAQRALETGNVNVALPYAPASAEAEIVAMFELARRVRADGGDAQALADRTFMETVVRLHRMGEGASFTGLRPAGTDYGPMVPAAERALETRDLSEIKAILTEEVEHGLAERLAHLDELGDVEIEPSDYDDVAAARERISAELDFIIYAEGLRQAVAGAEAAHHE